MKKMMFFIMGVIALNAEGASQKTLIWDLGGVLLSNSKFTYVRSIGLRPIMSYMVKERTFPWRFSARIQKRLFEVLSRVPVEGCEVDMSSCIPGGLVMPPLLWAFQAGFLDAVTCMKLAQETLDKLMIEGYFKNLAEKNLIERIISAAFSPALSVLSCTVRTQTFDLVKRLASMRHADGTKKYRLVVLSNWDPWSFVAIREKFSLELAHFDDVIISGDIKLMKPMHRIFEYVLEKHSIAKEDCIFIDDQLENIEGARTFGIKHAIHFKNSIHLRYELRRLKLF